MILGFYDEEKDNPVLITTLSIGYIVGGDTTFNYSGVDTVRAFWLIGS